MRNLFIITILAFISGITFAEITNFPDVPSHSWFAHYVNKIKDWGVVSGNDDGTFAPERNINRAEFAKMLTLYDKRVDQKIATQTSQMNNPSSAPSNNTIKKEVSVMYLEKFNGEPAECPSPHSNVKCTIKNF